jgi:amine acid ABC transporter, permease protein, 3-TM region, His/Glu/Gln/Arg/opine family
MIQTKSHNKSIIWLKENLFNSWGNSVLTCISSLAIFFIAKGILTFVFFTGKWDVISANLKILMVGQYPVSELWRLWLALCLVVFLLGISWGCYKGNLSLVSVVIIVIFAVIILLPFISFQVKVWLFVGIALCLAGKWIGRTISFAKKLSLVLWLVSIPFILILLNGFGIFKKVDSNFWGGFLLTILIAIVTIICSFPLGILLSLGRKSKLVVIRWFSIIYIEAIRGIPLITVLFGAQLLLPLFIGNGIELNNVLRVMIGFTLFNAAYIAETVRGGMQAIPRGQYEAAEALGLNFIQKTTFIIMPQALRNVIPALVGTVIEVFKDTSLVAIVSLMDLLGIAKRIIANPQFMGRQMEVFLFVAGVFLILSLVLSKVSKNLEASLACGKR